jgi:hypothetical protein
MSRIEEYRGFTRASVDALSEAYARDIRILSSRAPARMKAQVEKRLRENDELITEASTAWFVLNGFALTPNDVAASGDDETHAYPSVHSRLNTISEVFGVAFARAQTPKLRQPM